MAVPLGRTGSAAAVARRRAKTFGLVSRGEEPRTFIFLLTWRWGYSTEGRGDLAHFLRISTQRSAISLSSDRSR